MNKQRAAYRVVMGLAAMNAAWIAWHYAGATNTLYRHGDWQSTKVELSRSVFGAMSYVVSPIPLSTGALDLGAWHGFQEVVFERELVPATIRSRFKLAPHAYLAVIFAKAAGQSHGIILSTDEPPRHFTADDEGRFMERRTLAPSGVVSANDWHRLEIELGSHAVDVRSDSMPLASFPPPSGLRGRIGFRGGYEQALVDDVEVVDQNGKIALRESFFNRTGFWLAFALIAAAFAVVAVVVTELCRGRTTAPAYLYLASFQVAVLVCVAAYSLAGSSNRLGNLYPTELDLDGYTFRPNPCELPDDFEKRRDYYRARLAGEPQTVVLLGGSQTWGAGAIDDQRALETYLTRDLQATLGTCMAAVNLGKSGEPLDMVFQEYSRHWVSLLRRPSFVVANVSINDRIDPAAFEATVRELCVSNRERGIPTAIVLEGFSTESRFSSPSRDEVFASIGAVHDRLKRLETELACPVWDAHAYLTSRGPTGFLWWDFFHLTSYGQQLLAAFLADRIETLLQRCEVPGSDPKS